MAALGTTGFFIAALGLFEERGQDTGEGDEETNYEEAETHGSPEGGVAGGAGLLGDVGVGDAAGDESEEDEAASENVEVASHAMDLFYGFTAMLNGSGQL
jgi:hypothetical protein